MKNYNLSDSYFSEDLFSNHVFVENITEAVDKLILTTNARYFKTNFNASARARAIPSYGKV